jgi:hypothetical protein
MNLCSDAGLPLAFFVCFLASRPKRRGTCSNKSDKGMAKFEPKISIARTKKRPCAKYQLLWANFSFSGFIQNYEKWPKMHFIFQMNESRAKNKFESKKTREFFIIFGIFLIVVNF